MKRLTNLLVAIAVAVTSLVAVSVAATPAQAVGSYDNASIADIALRYVGRWGGAACVDAGRSGYQGGAPLGDSDNMDGECKAFVNCIVRMASGNTQWPAPGYASGFLGAGGVEVSEGAAVKGDIIQWGEGQHTAIVVANLGGGKFDVVDSNWVSRHKVGHHVINNVHLSGYSAPRFFRLGTVRNDPPPDTDGDGLADSGDRCPTRPGPAFLLGCPERIGVLQRDGTLKVKEGGLSAGWVTESSHVVQFAMSGTRIGVVHDDGSVWVKDGALDAGWVHVADTAVQVALAGSRVGVLHRDGVFKVKEGNLDAAWVVEQGSATQVALAGDRIGVLHVDGVLEVKAGPIDAGWVTEAGGVAQFDLSVNRIGYVNASGGVYAKEGGLGAAWIHEADGARKIDLAASRIGVVHANGDVNVKEGAMDAGWVLENGAVNDLALSPDRIGVAHADYSVQYKEGGLSAAWVTEEGNTWATCTNYECASRADTIRPSVTLSAPARFRLAGSVSLTWTATDTGSGVASYDVRGRSASYKSGFGAYQYPASWQRTSAASVTASGLPAGSTYCYSARARDRAGNVSGWSGERCTTVPLDDRALSGSGWTAKTGSAFYAGTAKATTSLGRTLSVGSTQSVRVALVATKCPTCGRVAIYAAGVKVGEANLYATTTARKQLIGFTGYALRSGTVTVKVLSTGKLVEIDGLAITRV